MSARPWSIHRVLPKCIALYRMSARLMYDSIDIELELSSQVGAALLVSQIAELRLGALCKV